jgi:addiction module HigA family antidote
MARLRTHPGEVLAEEYLRPLGMSASALAQAIGVPANRISDILRQRRQVSADTAIRLGRFFDVDPAISVEPPNRLRPVARRKGE